MKVFKTIVIDDERLARQELISVLKQFDEIEVIDEAKNGEEGIELIKKHQPDLVFLDISMPGMTGFEMLKKLDIIPYVIFVTAYDQYALEAFKVNALDYILKPIDESLLEKAIEKLKNSDEAEFESESGFVTKKCLSVADNTFIKDGENCYFLKVGDIRVLESDGNYVKVYFNESRPMILRTLNSFEERLDSQFFFRANRKFIVNLNWVESVENWFNGGLMLQLKTGEKIEVSRRQAVRFKEVFTL